jgi:hypothetical protein
MTPIKRDLPLNETMFSLLNNYLAIVAFLVPDLINEGAGVYENMSRLMPAPFWGLAFLLAGLLGFGGLYYSKIWIRRIALGLTTVLYGAVAVCYGMAFPNFGAGLYAVLAFISFEAQSLVQKSEL